MAVRRSDETHPETAAGLVHWLATLEYPPGDTDAFWEVFQIDGDFAAGLAVWRRLGPDILRAWIAQRPGTRPPGWWRFGAPRWQRADMPTHLRACCDRLLEGLPEPRARVGGTGTPQHECLGVIPQLDRGIPRHWITAFDVAFYSGKARDVHGQPIGEQYRGRLFRGEAIDPRNPPLFEAEAEYLRRHGLLSESERRRLVAADFAPVVVTEGGQQHG